jgi:hypothetical protein
MQGCFIFMSTLGLPLDVLFTILKENNIIIDWIDFYQDCIKNGWKHQTIINKLEHSLFDVYGKEYKNVIIERLKKCLV